MPSPRQDPYRSELQQLISRATTTAPTANSTEALEGYLTAHSALPGPRMNIALAEAPANDPREILPSTAALTYGQVAVARPDWWNDEVTKLHMAAAHPRWRVREMVAAALQRMLAADWQRTYQVLTNWLLDDDPLVIRASAAAIAEPPLLKSKARGDDALFIQARAVEWLARLPHERRREEPIGVLRKALGYTLSVAIAATPEAGLALLVQLSVSADKDIQWILRENLKKQRLKPYINELST